MYLSKEEILSFIDKEFVHGGIAEPLWTSVLDVLHTYPDGLEVGNNIIVSDESVCSLFIEIAKKHNLTCLIENADEGVDRYVEDGALHVMSKEFKFTIVDGLMVKQKTHACDSSYHYEDRVLTKQITNIDVSVFTGDKTANILTNIASYEYSDNGLLFRETYEHINGRSDGVIFRLEYHYRDDNQIDYKYSYFSDGHVSITDFNYEDNVLISESSYYFTFESKLHKSDVYVISVDERSREEYEPKVCFCTSL